MSHSKRDCKTVWCSRVLVRQCIWKDHHRWPVVGSFFTLKEVEQHFSQRIVKMSSRKSIYWLFLTERESQRKVCYSNFGEKMWKFTALFLISCRVFGNLFSSPIPRSRLLWSTLKDKFREWNGYSFSSVFPIPFKCLSNPNISWLI